MPKKVSSKKQWRFLFAELGPKKAKEMVSGTNYKNLPTKVKKKKKK